MPGREDFQYAVVRVVPRVERGESLNAGVVLFCRRLGFLGARTALAAAALAAVALAGMADPRLRGLEVERDDGVRPPLWSQLGLVFAFGALVGALIIGLVVELSPVLGMPGDFKYATAMLILILLLLVRPQGLLGKPQRVG